jgi:predicted RNA binding protein YcfA (HicA-like mRNA interferase family)
MNQSLQHLIKLLEMHGFLLKRSKGSHHIFYNSILNITVIVPVHNKDIKKGTFWLFLNKLVFTKPKYKILCTETSS